MPFVALAVLLGTLLFQQMPVIPSAWWLLLVVPLAFAFRLKSWSRILLFVPIGFFWAHAYALLTAPERLDAAFLTQEVSVSGQVVGIPESNGQRIVFDLLANQVGSSNEVASGSWRIRLSWDLGNDFREAPRSGDSWHLRVKLKEVHGLANPGSFDSEGWLYFQGIRYKGRVLGDGAQILSTELTLDAIRQRLSEFVNRSGSREQVLMQALLTGDRNGLQAADSQLFAATGTSHLIAISGLHIMLVAGMVYWLVQWLWKRIPSLCRRWPAKVAAVWPAMLVALGYSALAGFAVPTQRALIMLAVAMFALVARRATSPLNGLSLALLLVLLWNPPALLSAGFWLSFLAVAIILFSLSTKGAAPLWWRTQWWISLGLAPVLLVFQMQVALVSPLVNLVAIPLFSLLVVPLLFAGVLLMLLWPAAGRLMLDLSEQVLSWFMSTLEWLVAHTGHYVFATPADWSQALLFALGILLLALPRGVPGKVAGLLLCLPLLFPAYVSELGVGEFRLVVLDVGQGLGSLVQTKDHALVFDTGPRFPSGWETGSKVVVPYLRFSRIEQLDLLLISHSDMDHAGGAKGVLDGIKVKDVLAGEPIERIQARLCERGQSWRWDGVDFEILHPQVAGQARDNAASCVLRVSGSYGTVLLTGDLEKEGEKELSAAFGEQLKADLVVAPHHGSNSSSSAAFVRTTSPSLVIYAAGYKNRWRFPARKVVERWAEVGAEAHNTGVEGALQVEYSSRPYSGRVESYRLEHARYWMHQPAGRD